MRDLTPQEENLVNGGVLRFIRLILRPSPLGDGTWPPGSEGAPFPFEPLPDDPPHMQP